MQFDAALVKDFGLTEVHCAVDPQVDLVFVHGLNGHPYKTWSTQKPQVFWPADLLPKEIEVPIRVLTFGYNAKPAAFLDGASTDRVHNHGESLIAKLVANRNRKKALERPLIFVCHSLGGIVVKSALVHSRDVQNVDTERLRSVYISTAGILFMGTPHNGSDLASWGTLLQSICSAVLPKKLFDSQSDLIKALETDNETLQVISRRFMEARQNIRIYFFHESKPTDLRGTRKIIVPEPSAAPSIERVERMGIEADHSHICKFDAPDSTGFEVVVDAISNYSEYGIEHVNMIWQQEHAAREQNKLNLAANTLGRM